MNTIPTWVNKGLYPFESRFATIDNHRIHYVDEGQGELLLFVHGTPEWSFGFRDLIKNLRGQFRCIAIDLLGFGLSDKPKVNDYTCAGHALRLKKFIEQLELKNFSIVANDFGGSISMSYVIDNTSNINKVILFNTWMRSLKDDKHYQGPARILNTLLGKFLYLNMNLPVNVIMPAAYGDKRKLTKEVHAHYKNALPKGERQATYAFALEISRANTWWENIWNKIDRLNNRSFLFFWGMKDKFVPPFELENWKSKLPGSTYVPYDDAGHFVQEEKGDEMSNVIREFITKG